MDKEHRPDWLVNVTNDGWYGLSFGPYQHLAMAQTRAVEEGLPLVRSAYTGISAVIDPYGRILASLPLGQEGVLDARLPMKLAYLTPFSAWGNKIPLIMAGILIVLSWLGVLINRKRKQPVNNT